MWLALSPLSHLLSTSSHILWCLVAENEWVFLCLLHWSWIVIFAFDILTKWFIWSWKEEMGQVTESSVYSLKVWQVWEDNSIESLIQHPVIEMWGLTRTKQYLVFQGLDVAQGYSCCLTITRSWLNSQDPPLQKSLHFVKNLNATLLEPVCMCTKAQLGDMPPFMLQPVHMAIGNFC